MEQEGQPYVIFEGGMSGPEKDAAVERFRVDVPLLLCTESGGEGRNLQFCNTLVNFDLPWNPMTIEQRIGRLHRIGQTRDVFIFNLAVRGTLEEELLALLDEKINMFELVVGEIDAILGEMSEDQDFAELVFTAWVETTETERTAAFTALCSRQPKASTKPSKRWTRLCLVRSSWPNESCLSQSIPRFCRTPVGIRRRAGGDARPGRTGSDVAGAGATHLACPRLCA